MSLYLISLLPRSAAFSAARWIGRARYRRKRRAIQLNEGFADVADRQRVETWVRDSFELASCEDLEACLYPRLREAKNLSKLIEIRGLENLDRVLERGKGAILYSGHVRGHFTLFAALGRLGYKPNLVGRVPGWGHLPAQRRFYEWRDAVLQRSLGCRFVPILNNNPGVAAKAVNALRRNEVVMIEIDKTASQSTAGVRFFNRKEEFPRGPVLIAQASGAPLLSFFLHRTEAWLPLVGEIGPPHHVSSDLAESLQHCASRLEEKIRLHPAMWYHLWLPQWQLGPGPE